MTTELLVGLLLVAVASLFLIRTLRDSRVRLFMLFAELAIFAFGIQLIKGGVLL